MNRIEVAKYLRDLADEIEGGEVKIASETHKANDPRITVKLMIYKPRKDKDKDPKDISIEYCMKCSGAGVGCSTCDGFGWLVLNKIDEETVDYTPLLYNW